MHRFLGFFFTAVIWLGSLLGNRCLAESVSYQSVGTISSIEYGFNPAPLPPQFGTVSVGDTLSILYSIDLSIPPDAFRDGLSIYHTAVDGAGASLNGGSASISPAVGSYNPFGPNLSMGFDTATGAFVYADGESGWNDCFCTLYSAGFGSGGQGAYFTSTTYAGEGQAIASTTLHTLNSALSPVPIPASWMLFASAVLGMAIFRNGRPRIVA